jgi:hypothetical protein
MKKGRALSIREDFALNIRTVHPLFASGWHTGVVRFVSNIFP